MQINPVRPPAWFRFNNRKELSDADRVMAVVDGMVGRCLIYASLTGSVGKRIH